MGDGGWGNKDWSPYSDVWNWVEYTVIPHCFVYCRNYGKQTKLRDSKQFQNRKHFNIFLASLEVSQFPKVYRICKKMGQICWRESLRGCWAWRCCLEAQSHHSSGGWMDAAGKLHNVLTLSLAAGCRCYRRQKGLSAWSDKVFIFLFTTSITFSEICVEPCRPFLVSDLSLSNVCVQTIKVLPRCLRFCWSECNILLNCL